MNKAVITITITHDESNAPVRARVEGKQVSTSDFLMATTRLLEVTQENILKDTGCSLSDVIATLLETAAQSDDAKITDNDGMKA